MERKKRRKEREREREREFILATLRNWIFRARSQSTIYDLRECNGQQSRLKYEGDNQSTEAKKWRRANKNGWRATFSLWGGGRSLPLIIHISRDPYSGKMAGRRDNYVATRETSPRACNVTFVPWSVASYAAIKSVVSRRKGGDGASKTLFARLLHARKNKQPPWNHGDRKREREGERKRNWIGACRFEACARAEERKLKAARVERSAKRKRWKREREREREWMK